MTNPRNLPFFFFHFFHMKKVKRSDENNDHNYAADISITKYLIIFSL